MIVVSHSVTCAMDGIAPNMITLASAVLMDLGSISFHLVSVEDVVMLGVSLIMLNIHIFFSNLPQNWDFMSRDFIQQYRVLGYWDLLGDLAMKGDAS